MEETAATSPYRWVILSLGVLTVFASLGLARFGYTIVLPAMQQGLGMDNTRAGVLATANLAGYLALAAVGGALASRFGPRAVITAGLAVVAAGMALTGLAQGLAGALVWRTVTGLGSGASNVPVMGLQAAWFDARRRGLASGIVAGGSSVALILLGPLAPRILAGRGEDGWRVCWFGFAAVTLVVAALGLIWLRNRPGTAATGDERQPGSARPATAGLQWGAVYAAPSVWHLGAVYVAFGFSYIIYLTFFVKALIAEGGYSQAAAGRLFMVMGWCSLLCGVIWGAVSDAIGRKRALIAAYLVQATAFGLFGLSPSAPGFTVSAVLFGLTAWSIPAIMAAACGDLLGPRLTPAALGFITLFFGLGQACGPTVAGMVADATGSLLPPMLLAGGVALLGALGAGLLGPIVAREGERGNC